MKMQALHFVPDAENIVWMHWDTVRDTPEETEALYTRFARYWVRTAWYGEEGVCVEEDAVPVEQERSRKVAAYEDSRNARDDSREDGRVDVREETDVGTRSVSAFYP